MHNGDFLPTLPLAATTDWHFRLPPFQQVLYTPEIMASLILLVAALVVVVYFSYRARIRAKQENRLEALRMVRKILLKRNGTDEDVKKVIYTLNSNPKIDPAAVVMIRERFIDQFQPLLAKSFGEAFANAMETIYFPPPKDTRRALGDQPEDLKALVEERRVASASQAAAAILDLMDAILRPGVSLRLAFEGIEGGHECLVMGHDIQSVNVTLPANNHQLIAAIKPGIQVEGSLESGPSLMAFTAEVVQAVAGSMPYCRMTAWKSAWEVRKRDAVRLPISIEIDFQHIPTSASSSIKVANLGRDIGNIKPGRLVDISLGGCCIESPSTTGFTVGDMIRFSKSLIPGSPDATLLGAVVNSIELNPVEHGGSRYRLHVQFLVLDDVSQRILVRIIRQLQDIDAREKWLQAQQIISRMRQFNISNISSPAEVPSRKKKSTVFNNRPASPVKRGTTELGMKQGRTEDPGREDQPSARNEP